MHTNFATLKIITLQSCFTRFCMNQRVNPTFITVSTTVHGTERHGTERNGTERHRLRLYRHFGSVCYALILPLLICQAKKGNRCRKRYTKTGILTDIFYMQERRFLYFFNRIPVRTSLSSLILSLQFCI